MVQNEGWRDPCVCLFEATLFGRRFRREKAWTPTHVKSETKPNAISPLFHFGAFCLAVRTLTFCQLMGFPYYTTKSCSLLAGLRRFRHRVQVASCSTPRMGPKSSQLGFPRPSDARTRVMPEAEIRSPSWLSGFGAQERFLLAMVAATWLHRICKPHVSRTKGQRMGFGRMNTELGQG